MDKAVRAGAIALSADDNVATMLRAYHAGETIHAMRDKIAVTVVAREPIALCHTICIAAVDAGAAIIKYG